MDHRREGLHPDTQGLTILNFIRKLLPTKSDDIEVEVYFITDLDDEDSFSIETAVYENNVLSERYTRRFPFRVKRNFSSEEL